MAVKFPCPAWFNMEAKKEWKRVIKLLNDSDLKEIDTKALEGYCMCYSKWKDCEEIIKDKGYTFSTENGYIQQRPEVSIGNKALSDMRSFSKELGLTPAARSRMSKNSGVQDNEDEDEEMKQMIQ